MTTETQELEQLRSALTDTLEASRHFHTLMARERQALSDGALDALRTLIEEKRDLTETLLDASQRLLGWCVNQGIEPEYEAFAQWTESLEPALQEELRERWRGLRQSLELNDRDHAVNRQLLAGLSRHNEARLSLLQNLVNTTTPTYSQRGSFAPSPSGGWVDSV